MNRKTNALDAHIGAFIKAERVQRGISQDELASGLEITFQQVQKYEKAANRVSASRLYDIATILNVPIARFYEGYDQKNLINEDGNDGITRYQKSINNNYITELDRLISRLKATNNKKLINKTVSFLKEQFNDN